MKFCSGERENATKSGCMDLICIYESLMNSHIYIEVIGNIHDNPELLEV